MASNGTMHACMLISSRISAHANAHHRKLRTLFACNMEPYSLRVASWHPSILLVAAIVMTSLLPCTEADCRSLNSTGAFNKGDIQLSWGVQTATNIWLTSLSVYIRGFPSPSNPGIVSTQCNFTFKAESIQASGLPYTNLNPTFGGYTGRLPTWYFSQPLSAGATGAFRITCSSQIWNIQYSATPGYNGATGVFANDGTLSVLPGVNSNNLIRYFNGVIGYTTSASSNCTPAPPPPSPPYPPPGAQPAGTVYVFDEPSLLTAIANPSVSKIMIGASIILHAPIVVNRTSLLSISGDTASCILRDGLANAGAQDYDYAQVPGLDITPLPAMCTLNAQKNGRHLTVFVNNFTIANLQLLNGRSGASYSLNGVGGSVAMMDAVSGSQLTSSPCSSSLFVISCSFGGNAGLYGGSIAACMLNVSNSIFRDGSAQYGGDVAVAGPLYASNCSFIHSWSWGYGGSIYSQYPYSFPNPFILGVTSVITNSLFTLAWSYPVSSQRALGGAIYVAAGNNAVVVSQTSFVGFLAASGGAVYLGQSSNMTLANVTISGCGVTGNGGGVYADQYTFLNLIDTVISGNTAGASGGGVYAGLGAAVFSFSTNGVCEFINNSANALSGQGGAVFLGQFASIWFDMCTLSGNSAYEGGAVYASPNTANQVNSYAPHGYQLYVPSLLRGSASDAAWTTLAQVSGPVTAVLEQVCTGTFIVNLSVSFCGFNGIKFARCRV